MIALYNNTPSMCFEVMSPVCTMTLTWIPIQIKLMRFCVNSIAIQLCNSPQDEPRLQSGLGSEQCG